MNKMCLLKLATI